MKLTKRLILCIVLVNVCLVLARTDQGKRTVHKRPKRLWRSWVGAEVRKLETRSLKAIASDDVIDENGPQLQELDVVNFGQDELQVDFDSPEYRKMVLEEEQEGNLYEDMAQ